MNGLVAAPLQFCADRRFAGAGNAFNQIISPAHGSMIPLSHGMVSLGCFKPWIRQGSAYGHITNNFNAANLANVRYNPFREVTPNSAKTDSMPAKARPLGVVRSRFDRHWIVRR